jgi:hypothetical protein
MGFFLLLRILELLLDIPDISVNAELFYDYLASSNSYIRLSFEKYLVLLLPL